MLSNDQTFTGTNTFSGAVVFNGALSGTSVKDEDNMISDSATAISTQQSVKAYVDNYMTAIIVNDGEIITNGGEIIWQI